MCEEPDRPLLVTQTRRQAMGPGHKRLAAIGNEEGVSCRLWAAALRLAVKPVTRA